MFRNSYQGGMLSIFYAGGTQPLAIWDARLENGNITRFLDQDIKAMVLEIRGTNVSTAYITCPKGSQVLGVTMPFLVMIVKNLKKYFSFEITIMDQTGVRRRFRASNFQSKTQIQPLCTVMPIGLCDGWNQIQFNLADFTTRAYNQQFREVHKVKVNANIRLRRIYFADRLIPEEELPPAYKLFFPIKHKNKKEERRQSLEKKLESKSQEQKLDSKTQVITEIKPPDLNEEELEKLSVRGEEDAIVTTPLGVEEVAPEEEGLPASEEVSDAAEAPDEAKVTDTSKVPSKARKSVHEHEQRKQHEHEEREHHEHEQRKQHEHEQRRQHEQREHHEREQREHHEHEQREHHEHEQRKQHEHEQREQHEREERGHH